VHTGIDYRFDTLYAKFTISSYDHVTGNFVNNTKLERCTSDLNTQLFFSFTLWQKHWCGEEDWYIQI